MLWPLQVTLDLAHGHAARIHRDDLVIEARESPWRSTGGRTSRHDRGEYPDQSPMSRPNRLGTASIASVRSAMPILVLKMFVELHIQETLRHRLFQIVEQTAKTSPGSRSPGNSSGILVSIAIR